MVESLQSSIKAAMLQSCLLKCIGNINDEKKNSNLIYTFLEVSYKCKSTYFHFIY